MTQTEKNSFTAMVSSYGTHLDDRMVSNFSLYMERLLEWNKRINLTAITERTEIQIKHFLDSVAVLGTIKIKIGAALIDIGSGAGFPAIPLKIVRPDLNITMIDSLYKRTLFLEEISGELGQDNTILHARAEDCGKRMEYRERFDFVTSRAVANLRILSEYCLPFLKTGGIFIAFKGYEVENEIEESLNAIRELGGRYIEKIPILLPGGYKRSFVIIEKISQTCPFYPRRSAKITKTPI